MPRFYWKKLVRDKVVHHSEIDPKILDIVYRILDDKEYHSELVKKVTEEAEEIPYEPGDTKEDLKEIADLQAVVDAMRISKGYSESEVDVAKARKVAKKGGFELRHYVDYVDLANDSEWVAVFRAQPGKYREEEI